MKPKQNDGDLSARPGFIRRRTLTALALAPVLFGAGGCHRSLFLEARIQNDSAQKLSIVEIDYPNASFGLSTMAPGAGYSYRFKPQASGSLQLSYNDGSGKAHLATGPQVHEGETGTITVHIPAAGAPTWSATP